MENLKLVRDKEVVLVVAERHKGKEIGHIRPLLAAAGAGMEELVDVKGWTHAQVLCAVGSLALESDGAVQLQDNCNHPYSCYPEN